MGLIIDTCIFIQAEKKGVLNDFSQWTDEAIYISAVTASELLVGVHHADTADRRIKRTAFVDYIFSNIPVLDFTLDVARIHAELYVDLAKKGNMIGSHDLIIAATALSNDCKLLTNNIREFERISSLKIYST